eukprot:225888-Pyramimonas_sp.AAC.1
MAAQRLSRASGPQFRVHPVRAAQSKREVAINGQRAHWWVRVHTILRGVARHRHKANGPKQLRQYLTDAKKLVGDRPEGIHSILRPGKDA